MKKLIFFLILIYLYTQSMAQYPLVQWAQKLQAGSVSTSAAPYTYVSESALDADGNIYIAGFFADTLYPNPSAPGIKLIADPRNTDAVFFAKYNPAGNLLWAKTVGAGHALDIELDRLGQIYITGYGSNADSADFDPGPGKALYTSGTQFMFMCKYDNNGNYINSRFFNGVGVKGFGITTDSLLNIYVSGCVRNTVDFDPGAGTAFLTRHNTTVNRDGFYAKYDSNMNFIWARLDIQTRDCEDIAVHHASGRVLVASQALRLINFNGITTDSLVTGIAGTNSVRFDNDGNMYISGYFGGSNVNFNWNGTNTLSTSATTDEYGFLVKYNALKAFQWVQKYKVTYDVFNARVSTLNNNILLAYFESDGVVPHRGFLKINPATGAQIGRATDIVTNTGGERLTTALYSAIDNSIVFTGSCGRGNNAETVDFDPDTAVAAERNITGLGIWGYVAKYSDCTAPPVQPGIINGAISLCNSGLQTYSITPVAGTTSYIWTLPGGWVGSSDSAYIHAQTSANGGIITVVAQNQCGISNTRTLTVAYTPAPQVVATTSNTVICAGQLVTLSATGATSYSWSSGAINNQPFAPANTTTYYVTGTTNGCAGVDSVNVTVYQPGATNISAAICNGNSYLLNGVSLTTSGVYRDTLQTTSGCDSVITLTLIIRQQSVSSISVSICPGQTYLFKGLMLVAPGTYRDTLQNSAGCDSIITLILNIKQPTSSAISVAICNGQSYFFNGVNRTMTGVYRDTLVNAAGCDSVITLTLTVKQNTSAITSAVICEGRSYLFNGTSITAQGVYRDTLINGAGCDSVITLNLTVVPRQYTSLQANICSGTFYQFGTRQLDQSGFYTDTLPAFNTCDSIVTVMLQVDSILTTTINASVCTGSSYTFNGQQLIIPGNYYDTLAASTGCDSIVTLHLQIDTLPDAFINITGNTKFCAGDSVELSVLPGNIYSWNTTANTSSIVVKQSGNYSLTVTNNNNCSASSDSIEIIVNPLPAAPVISRVLDTLYTTPAYSYQWYVNQAAINGATENSIKLNQSGDYFVVVTDSLGCQNRSLILSATGVQINDVTGGYNFELYPNPNKGLLTIKHTYNGYLRALIIDALGRVVSILNIQKPVSVLNISELPAGFYLLVTTNELNEKHTFKMIKE